jgi:nitroimidazol reductase NimA-like FMN-containing flavoprotein (pyridoxamine 5'-phosphate oxidase superfamily)
MLERPAYPVTERTRVRRRPVRASYDVDVVRGILDAGLVCQLGFVWDGKPAIIPTAYVRVDDALVVHGSTKNRTLVALAGGAEVCCTVTHLDGLVLARSAFHHSVNYRSVVVYGRAAAVEAEDEKERLLRAFFDHLYPGRWEIVRPPTAAEMRATLVVRIPITEVSAKVRTGPPIDDDEDYALPVWAGVAPLDQRLGTMVPDERIHDAVDPACAPAVRLFGCPS